MVKFRPSEIPLRVCSRGPDAGAGTDTGPGAAGPGAPHRAVQSPVCATALIILIKTMTMIVPMELARTVDCFGIHC